MSVLIYAESVDGEFKKYTFELVSYAKKVAEQVGTTLTAVTINANDPSQLGKYGADKVLKVSNDKLKNFNAKAYKDILVGAVNKEGSKIVLLPSTANSNYFAPLLAVELNAGIASNVIELPSSISPLVVKRTAFSNKAFSNLEISSDIKILVLSKNSYGIFENEVSSAIEEFAPNFNDNFTLSVDGIEKIGGKVTIEDADIIVSGGRGLKGPENWGMIEEMAEILNAALACSKPVADVGWRSHEEHVGQTGKLVSSNLYIAIGISGAIQHIAGINASKVKVVINNDPEAPFFKVADYGIVGDAFEVVPKLNQKLKEFKANNN